jgi:single-stranded-DNA-specific exonuclease
MKRKWILPEQKDDQDKNDLINLLMEKRGVIGGQQVEEFLSDHPQQTYDPLLMKDMEESARKILSTIEQEKEICIYGDYDCDGVCAISLLLEVFTKLSARVSYYIPSRFEEGYGLNMEAVKAIKDKGTDLIVTVDCGSVSMAEVKYAEEIGLSIIVTDHHNLNDRAATCLLINPKQSECSYPERELSGCGVAFKLAQALQRLGGNLTKKDLNDCLDLVAIATIGDIVSLMGENRTLVKYGLRVINSGRRPGLAKLIEKTGLKTGEIKSSQIAYVIVPHLNAAGRMLSAETGVTLLSSHDALEIEKATNLLVEQNKERRRNQEGTYEEALTIVSNYHKDDLFLVIEMPNAHEGIAGIVAGKLKDAFHRPAILVTPTGEDFLKGTGRSIEGVDLYVALATQSQLFERFGGHAGACGFQLKRGNLPLLRDAMNEMAKELYRRNPEIFEPKIEIDAILGVKECDLELLRVLEKMEPFGHKNPKPLFFIGGLIPEAPFYMGNEKQHVRFQSEGLSFILFHEAESFRSHQENGAPLDLIGYPEINRWNGREKLQFVATDIRWYNE